jgi:transcriptional regulator MraZ
VFVGTFEHSLDDKGRIVLPAPFRQYLAERGFVSQFDQCLGLWTPEGFEAVAQRLTERVRAGEASQMALRAFFANAHEVRPDSQGRIGIPERLRSFAGLERDVVVIGAFDRIELWDASRWQTLQPESDQSLTEAVTQLGI